MNLTGAIKVLDSSFADRLHALNAQVSSTPWSENSFISECDKEHSKILGFIETSSDALVGLISFNVIGDESEITNLAVIPTHQRQGIGRKLLEEALVMIRNQRVASIYLEVRESNERAITLYQSCGFKPVGRRKAYYRSPDEDALILEAQ